MTIPRIRPIALIVAASMALAIPTMVRAGSELPQIRRGMTKAQVEKIYGEPNQRTETDSGTTWTYIKGMSKAFIPFYGAFHSPTTIVVNFHGNRVASYSVEQ
jgi:hypothetical protein